MSMGLVPLAFILWVVSFKIFCKNRFKSLPSLTQKLTNIMILVAFILLSTGYWAFMYDETKALFILSLHVSNVIFLGVYLLLTIKSFKPEQIDNTQP